MTESIYKEYQNKYYNPNDNDKKPGDNDNWKSIQEGFHRIGSTQLETSAGLTLGKGTADETSVTAAQLAVMKQCGVTRKVFIPGLTLTGLESRVYLYTSVNSSDTINKIKTVLRDLYALGYTDIRFEVGFVYGPSNKMMNVVIDRPMFITSGSSLAMSYIFSLGEDFISTLDEFGFYVTNKNNDSASISGIVLYITGMNAAQA